MTLNESFRETELAVEAFMKRHTDAFYRQHDFACSPETVSPLFDAFSYSLYAGGKRLRPFLVRQFCTLCGGNADDALSYAAAIEMIHTFSLIHDDLPAMDNDDLRRGKPTNHKVFGEAGAILAGDALSLYAFEVLTDNGFSAERNLRASKLLASRAGVNGMIAGQQMDMWAEAHSANEAQLTLLQNKKTGALFECACLLGCIAADVPEDAPAFAAAKAYARHFGLAFQITDDILDVIGDTDLLGKKVGSDENNGKSTFVTLLGLDGAEKKAKIESESAKEALYGAGFDAERARLLAELADYVITRKN